MKSNLSVYSRFGCALHTRFSFHIIQSFCRNQIKTENKQQQQQNDEMRPQAAGCLMRPQRNIKIYGAYRLRKRSEWRVENIVHDFAHPLLKFPVFAHNSLPSLPLLSPFFCSINAHTHYKNVNAPNYRIKISKYIVIFRLNCN